LPGRCNRNFATGSAPAHKKDPVAATGSWESI
jgi:hypothetical protein